MADKEWTVKDLMEALKRFSPEAKVYYEMGPNGPGTIGKAQYVKVWGEDDEPGVLLDRCQGRYPTAKSQMRCNDHRTGSRNSSYSKVFSG
jgi:hypothetical protein